MSEKRRAKKLELSSQKSTTSIEQPTTETL
jgi:hypothetical protein